ncbi:EamA family transporter [Actinoallomurus sp. NPDC052274]|uniref:EamA family transporter n=1 Tax=Actinoallomurus sp. NPDC052274 TaxID=3155420 RepID=UPI003415E7EC
MTALILGMVSTVYSNVQLVVLKAMGFSSLMSIGCVTAIGGALVLPLAFRAGFSPRRLWRAIVTFMVVNMALNIFYVQGAINCSLVVFGAVEVAGTLITALLIGLFEPVARHVIKQRTLRGFEGPFATRADVQKVAWALVTLLGVMPLVLQPGEGAAGGHTNLFGIVCAGLTGAGVAVRTAMTNKLKKESQDLVRGWSGLAAGLGLIVIALFHGASMPEMSGGLLIAVLSAAMTNTAIPTAVEVFALRKLASAVTVNVILATAPAVALLIAWLEAGPAPDAIKIAAIFVVALGAVMVARSEAKQAALKAFNGNAAKSTDEPTDEPAAEPGAEPGVPLGTSGSRSPKPERGQRRPQPNRPSDAPARKLEADRNRIRRRRARGSKNKH